jgi:SHS2 domain-containing protein
MFWNSSRPGGRPPFAFLDHAADVKLRVSGATREELFRNALRGMAAVQGPRPGGWPVRRRLELEASTSEDLLVDFLNEALASAEVHGETYVAAGFRELTDRRLSATLWGVKVRGFSRQVKGATHHDLAIRHADGAWEADVVFDV